MMPKVAATIRPPTNAKRDRPSSSPTPSPMRIIGQSCHRSLTWASLRRPGPDRQRDRAGEDQEDAPAQGASSDVHGSTVPCARGRVLASRPVRGRYWRGSMRLSEWMAAAPHKDSAHAQGDGGRRADGLDARRRHGSGLLGGLGRRSAGALHDLRRDRRRPGPGHRPGERAGRGPAGRRQAHPLEPGPAGRPRGRDAGRAPDPERAARRADPARDGRDRRSRGGVRAGRPGRGRRAAARRGRRRSGDAGAAQAGTGGAAGHVGDAEPTSRRPGGKPVPLLEAPRESSS